MRLGGKLGHIRLEFKEELMEMGGPRSSSALFMSLSLGLNDSEVEG